MSEYNRYQCMESRHLTGVCLNTMCLIFILGTDTGEMNFACILRAARFHFACRAFEGKGDEDPKITHHLSTDYISEDTTLQFRLPVFSSRTLSSALHAPARHLAIADCLNCLLAVHGPCQIF